MRGKIECDLKIIFVQFLASNVTYLDPLLTCMLMVLVDSVGGQAVLNFAEYGAYRDHDQTV